MALIQFKRGAIAQRGDSGANGLVYFATDTQELFMADATGNWKKYGDGATPVTDVTYSEGTFTVTKSQNGTPTTFTITPSDLGLEGGSATIASKNGNVVTLKAGLAQSDSTLAISNNSGTDITLAAVASTGDAEDITVDSDSYGGSSNVTNLQAALDNLADAVDAAAAGGVLSLAGGTGTGSATGVSVSVSPNQSTGAVTLGVTVDDSALDTYITGKVAGLWHFKGTVATVAALDNVSNPAEGDVYQVTADGSEYAYNGSAWVELGTVMDLSAYTVKSVDTTASNGINLSNTNGVVDVVVTPGSVAANNTSVVLGGDVYTAINNAITGLDSDASLSNTDAAAVTGATKTSYGKALTKVVMSDGALQDVGSNASEEQSFDLAGAANAAYTDAVAHTVNGRALSTNPTLSANDIQVKTTGTPTAGSVNAYLTWIEA